MIALETNYLDSPPIPPTAQSIEVQRQEQIQALVDIRRILDNPQSPGSTFRTFPVKTVRTWS